MTDDSLFTRRMVTTVVTVALAFLLLVALYVVREALLLIYVAALLAMGFAPVVRLIERPRGEDGRLRVPRFVAILLIYVAVVAGIAVVALLVIPPLVAQAEQLWAKLPGRFNDFQTFLIRHRLMVHRVTLQEAVQNAPSGTGGNAVGTVLVAISTFIGGVFGLVTVLILSFYFLIEAESLRDYLLRFVPPDRRATVRVASREAVLKVSAWLRAQFVLAVVMGSFATVGLAAMGVPYFYVVAMVAAIGETIPVVGPIIGGVSAVAVALTVSPRLAVMVGAYFLLLHQIEANVLVPKIMERRVGVSPVTVMVALLLGGAMFGLIGAILAIPTAAILSVVLEEIAPDEPAADQPV